MCFSLEVFVIMWMYKGWRSGDRGCLVSLICHLAFELGYKPGCVNIIWLTETTCPGLVAVKTCLPDSLPFACQNILVVSPKLQLAHCGGVIFARFFGIFPYFPFVSTCQMIGSPDGSVSALVKLGSAELEEFRFIKVGSRRKSEWANRVPLCVLFFFLNSLIFLVSFQFCWCPP